MNDTSLENCQFCTELWHPVFSESLAAASGENPHNVYLPDSFTDRDRLSTTLAGIDAPLIAVLFQKKWRPGRRLRIAFLGTPNPVVKDKIIHYARQWLQHVNLSFDFVTGPTGDIRISTVPGGSWSYIGTDALARPAQEATMNYGWLTPTTREDEFSRVVLHEFGHALGAIHEHQHPGVSIPWNREAVYRYYAGMGWSQQQVDHNIFRHYETNQLNSSSYDRDSIMHYAVPPELTHGGFSIGWNQVLSSADKAHMRQMYPSAAPAPVKSPDEAHDHESIKPAALLEDLDLRVELIPEGRPNRPGTPISPRKITIHNTSNSSAGADAAAHSRFVRQTGYYMHNGRRNWVSWHYTVDDRTVIRQLPDGERAYHAGSAGNRSGIGIEICMHRGIDQSAANDRAARLAAFLIHEHGLTLDDLVTHQHWTGKFCPELLLSNSGQGWESFKDLTRRYLSGLQGEADDASSSPASAGSSDFEFMGHLCWSGDEA